jgi:hypothetical protein
MISRDTGELRLWVCDTANKEPCQAIVTTHLPPGSTLSTAARRTLEPNQVLILLAARPTGAQWLCPPL